MKRKMYILRTWMYEGYKNSKLSVYITDNLGEPLDAPYVTTSRLSAKKFYTKKDAIKYGKFFGGCYVDCVWYVKKECHGQVFDLWK